MTNGGEWSYIGEAWPHRGGRGPWKRGLINHYKGGMPE